MERVRLHAKAAAFRRRNRQLLVPVLEIGLREFESVGVLHREANLGVGAVRPDEASWRWFVGTPQPTGAPLAAGLPRPLGPVAAAIVGSQRNIITFENGHLMCPAWNKNLYEFLMLSNQCEQNTNKVKSIKNAYKLLDFSGSDDNIVELGKRKDMAYDLARNASLEDMIPHAKYLGISFVHPSTGVDRDYDAIREDYKSKALKDPDNFLLFANNPRIKTIYLIEQGLKRGVITTKLVKGQLHWSGSKQLITAIDPNKKESEAIADFAATEEGEGFIKTLRVQL